MSGELRAGNRPLAEPHLHLNEPRLPGTTAGGGCRRRTPIPTRTEPRLQIMSQNVHDTPTNAFVSFVLSSYFGIFLNVGTCATYVAQLH